MANFPKSWALSAMCILAMLMFVVSGCNERNNNDKVLKVGISPDYPPFEIYNNGEIVGFDLDVINKIAEHMGKKLQFHPLSFDNLIGALENNRIDLAISSMTYTDERAKKVDFSQPYYHNTFAMVYRNGHPIKDTEALKGKKIGAQTGSTMDKFLKRVGDVQIFSLNNNNIMIEELILGRIDGVLLEKVQAIEFVRSHLSLRCQLISHTAQEGYSIAFPKDSSLRDEVNSVIQKMHDNGELEAIKHKWIIEGGPAAEDSAPKDTASAEELL